MHIENLHFYCCTMGQKNIMPLSSNDKSAYLKVDHRPLFAALIHSFHNLLFLRTIHVHSKGLLSFMKVKVFYDSPHLTFFTRIHCSLTTVTNINKNAMLYLFMLVLFRTSFPADTGGRLVCYIKMKIIF